jgi:hypothetical protein
MVRHPLCLYLFQYLVFVLPHFVQIVVEARSTMCTQVLRTVQRGNVVHYLNVCTAPHIFSTLIKVLNLRLNRRFDFDLCKWPIVAKSAKSEERRSKSNHLGNGFLQNDWSPSGTTVLPVKIFEFCKDAEDGDFIRTGLRLVRQCEPSCEFATVCTR